MNLGSPPPAAASDGLAATPGRPRPVAGPRVGPGLGSASLAVLAIGAVGIGLASGSSGFGWPTGEVLWQIRWPRVLAGFGAGAALALAGALLQQLSRNALADPYVMGVSSGAAVAALAWMLLAGSVMGVAGLPAAVTALVQHPIAVSVAAAAGAAAAMALLLALSWRMLARTAVLAAPEAPVALLLIGVMIGSGGTAAVSLMLALAPEAQLRGMVFWLLGDLNGVMHWAAVWIGVALALALAWPHARALDWLARGEAWASTLGVDVPALQRRTLVAAALATGAAVATAGAIGFVGLVVPHAMRLLGLRRMAVLLPSSVVAGGAFVVLADALARTVVAPVQLPVGVICAALGVPAFIALLLRGSSRAGRG